MPTMFKSLISVLALFFLFPLRFVYVNGRRKAVFSIDIFLLGDCGFDAQYSSVIDFYHKYIPQLFNQNISLVTSVLPVLVVRTFSNIRNQYKFIYNLALNYRLKLRYIFVYLRTRIVILNQL